MSQILHVLLSPVVGVFANEIWKPIKRHSSYCLKPKTSVGRLAKATTYLKDAKDTIEEKIQLGELQSKRLTEQAQRWIDSARSAVDESYMINNKYEGRKIHFFGCSWNCFFNYRIGKAAAKTKSDADELNKIVPRDGSIFSLLPPVGRELPLPPNIVGQTEYRDKIVGDIKQGCTMSFIGICGMGGAGKTTLLKQLNNVFSGAAEAHEFDHVIYVEVGQQQHLSTVQHNIAAQLGLALGQDESCMSRSASIYNFLKERRFLLLIDDLWQMLDLVNVGVPQGSTQVGPRNRQMVIITTRLQHVCHGMQAHAHVIVLQRLKSDQAWSLFEVNAGRDKLTNSNSQIKGYAKRIVEKCGGLPLALKIVGQAMASKRSEHEWEHTVMLLQQSQFHKVPDAGSDLYHVLYVSYDQLPDERTKQCFLFVVLTTHDCVYVPYTIDFWMSHGLIGDDGDVRNNYLRGHSVLGCLKRACLLEEHPRGESYVRMHDIVRDLALWIVATQQGDGPNKNWLVRHRGEEVEPQEWSSSIERISLRNKSDVAIPDARSCAAHLLLTLVLDRNLRICKVPTGLFTSTPSLTHLSLPRTSIQQLPSDIGALVNLQYLNLSETPLQLIPVELQFLKSLRYLYLGYTDQLKTIPDGTISALSLLRVLDMYKSGPFPEEKTRAYIEELESLAFLQFLGFTVTDCESLHRIFNLPLRFLDIQGVEGLRRLHMSPTLVSKTRARQLDTLALYGIESLESLLIGETDMDSDWYFKILDELRLKNLQNLKSIVWKGVVPHLCLPLLRTLQIEGCHSIRTITWIKQLPCLEEVYVVDCYSVLELASTDDDEGPLSCAATAPFPRLKVLGLSVLMNLHNICDDTLSFPCLQRLVVYECCMLEKLPTRLLKEDSAPLILGKNDWWQKLGWEDNSVKSTLFPFFRELPAYFQGSMAETYSALHT
jgi:disease resistance protein RPS2